MKRIILFLSLSILLFSCNKANSPQSNNENKKNEVPQQVQQENDSDTAMTVEEVFSTALVQDIMGEDEDPDLQEYLEDQIYPLVSKSNKITIDRISSSLYLLSYNDGGVLKNFIIQKFYNPAKDEFVFEKNETQSNALKQFVK